MIQYLKGDIFAVTPFPSILLHSCNCFGSWGGGVAAGFAWKFRSGLRAHEKYCKKYKTDPKELLGLSQVIATSRDDKGNKPIKMAESVSPKFIVCLFTSLHGGHNADSPGSILKNTDRALKNLETKLFSDPKDLYNITNDEAEKQAITDLRKAFENEKAGGEQKKLDIFMPQINSGIFQTPWEDTEWILKKHEKFFNFKILTLD